MASTLHCPMPMTAAFHLSETTRHCPAPGGGGRVVPLPEYTIHSPVLEVNGGAGILGTTATATATATTTFTAPRRYIAWNSPFSSSIPYNGGRTYGGTWRSAWIAKFFKETFDDTGLGRCVGAWARGRVVRGCVGARARGCVSGRLGRHTMD